MTDSLNSPQSDQEKLEDARSHLALLARKIIDRGYNYQIVDDGQYAAVLRTLTQNTDRNIVFGMEQAGLHIEESGDSSNPEYIAVFSFAISTDDESSSRREFIVKVPIEVTDRSYNKEPFIILNNKQMQSTDRAPGAREKFFVTLSEAKDMIDNLHQLDVDVDLGKNENEMKSIQESLGRINSELRKLLG